MLRIALPLLAALVLPLTAEAQRAQPQRLGNHQNWTAATHQEGGQKVCYAFARAASSEAAPPNRQNVTLTVTHRPGGRDQVAVSVGYALPRGAESVLTVGSNEFRSYGVVQSSAFFQNGEGLIRAFRAGRDAVARTPGPTGRPPVSDTFSLVGFTAAYEAISRECPAR
ncbi:invasion associated locus B family protein [Falsiroseomonas sp. HC035]|uniref:invasion associated locus B family protein n=1 Tax=Falsiroseomonas sp. HC035 TaxID=3390999 RepID=UPI003D30FBF9